MGVLGPNGGMGSARDLRAPQVAVRTQRLVMPAAVQVEAGGLLLPDADVHLLVLDIPNAEAWRIPMPANTLRTLRDQCNKALGEDNAHIL